MAADVFTVSVVKPFFVFAFLEICVEYHVQAIFFKLEFSALLFFVDVLLTLDQFCYIS